jgi:hypothetical protein
MSARMNGVMPGSTVGGPCVSLTTRRHVLSLLSSTLLIPQRRVAPLLSVRPAGALWRSRLDFDHAPDKISRDEDDARCSLMDLEQGSNTWAARPAWAT